MQYRYLAGRNVVKWLACLLLLVAPTIAQTPAAWFTVADGDTNCHAHLVTTASNAIYVVCYNPRGGFTGTFTPNTANITTDVLTFGLSAGVNNTGGDLCMIAINTTAAAVTIGSFGSVPPQSVGFQCAGSSGTSGQAAIAPITSLKPKGK